MDKSFKDIIQGYQDFRKKYVVGDNSVMEHLSHHGQKPKIMIIGCCDSRVDPALILQCDPGDLFVVRNVANIVPPYEADDKHHGTSAALEFGICHLKVKHLIILGHSQCGGIQAMLQGVQSKQNDFLSSWVNSSNVEASQNASVDDVSKQALIDYYYNCLTFPWIKDKIDSNELNLHLWFFDLKQGEICKYSFDKKMYHSLESELTLES